METLRAVLRGTETREMEDGDTFTPLGACIVQSRPYPLKIMSHVIMTMRAYCNNGPTHFRARRPSWSGCSSSAT